MGHLYHTDYRHLGISVIIHVIIISAALVFLPDVNLTAGIHRQGNKEREITVYISERIDLSKTAVFPVSETMAVKTLKTLKTEEAESLKNGSAADKSGSSVPAASIFQLQEIDSGSAAAGFSSTAPYPLSLSREQFIRAKAKEDIKISYPPLAARRNIEGSVTVEILIDETGKIRNAEIISSSGYTLLDKAAVEAVMQSEFIPAQLEGRNVSDRLTILIDYKLTKDYL